MPYKVEIVKNIEITERKYKTKSEIQQRAEELQKLKGKRNVLKLKPAQRDSAIPYTEFTAERVPTTASIDNIENSTEIYNEMEFYPISEFIEQARNEVFTVNRQIKKIDIRIKKVQKTIEINAEAFSHDYYINLAKQKIALEYSNA